LRKKKRLNFLLKNLLKEEVKRNASGSQLADRLRKKHEPPQRANPEKNGSAYHSSQDENSPVAKQGARAPPHNRKVRKSPMLFRKEGEAKTPPPSTGSLRQREKRIQKGGKRILPKGNV